MAFNNIYRRDWEDLARVCGIFIGKASMEIQVIRSSTLNNLTAIRLFKERGL
jgi:hypothetical protein